MENKNTKMCPRCGSQRFHVTTHVTQDWEVTGTGNFVQCIDDCVEVTRFANDSDIWDCAQCGYSAVGSTFNTPFFVGGKSWNPVLNFLVSLKRAYIKHYGNFDMWQNEESKSCVNRWADRLAEDAIDVRYKEVLKPISVRQYGKIVLLKYCILEETSGFWDIYGGLYRECRGVVIDLEHEYLVLAPFRKFFNLNETEETQEHVIREKISAAKCVELSDKLDGSMISARWCFGDIVLSGSGSFNPEASMHCQLGYKLLSEKHRQMLIENPGITFIFELIHPNDAHVVSYKDKEPGLYLIGMRDIRTGYEYSYDSISRMATVSGVKCMEVFNKSFDEAMASLDDKKSHEAEGFVINIDGYRLKLKYNDYVKVHKMLGKMISTNALIKIVDEGSWDDVRSKLPAAYRMQAEKVVKNIVRYIDGMNDMTQKAYEDTKKNYVGSETHDEKEDRRNYSQYVFEHHKPLAYYLMCIYDSKPYSFIRSASGRYMRYYQIVEENARKEF